MAVIKDSENESRSRTEDGLEFTPDDEDYAAAAADDRGPSTEGVESAQVVGAAVFGAVAGFLLGGSRTGLAAGIGAGIAATTQTAMGDVARSMGDVAVTAGHKAREVDEKHRVVEKTRAAAGAVASTTMGTIRELDEKHKIVEKGKQGVRSAYQSVVEFERKHNIVDNTAKKLSEGASFVTEKLTNNDKRNRD